MADRERSALAERAASALRGLYQRIGAEHARGTRSMPARDLYHDVVRNALTKDGWTITDDPLRLEFGGRRLFIDLGAERLIGAEKADRKIAVEVKSFVGASEMADLHVAVGQFVTYHDILERIDPSRELLLAIPIEVVIRVFDDPIGRILVENRRVALIGFDAKSEAIVRWDP